MEATIKEVIEEMGFDVTVRDVMDFIEDNDLMRIHTALKKISGTGKGLFWKQAFGEKEAECAFIVSELQYSGDACPECGAALEDISQYDWNLQGLACSQCSWTRLDP